MTTTFSIAREISLREIEAHQKRMVGLTASAPTFKDMGGGRTEFVCDVRVGIREGWGLIKDVLVSQWAIGIVTDIMIPVLIEKSEAGRLTIIARSQVRLPDISYTTYSWQDLDLVWMSGYAQDDAGAWRDGFGHAVTDPTTDTGSRTVYVWTQGFVEFGASEFVWGTTDLGATTAGWEET